MPGFINSTTNVTLENITYLGNITEPAEFFIKVNQVVYGGWLFFILLFVIWAILFIVANKTRDQPLNNIMYSGAIVTLLSFMLRGVYMIILGTGQGLLTDFQLWIFPLITIIVALIIYMTKE